jgi:hypothetical protein
MILDAENLFSDVQDVSTGSENGILSENTLDLGVAGRNIGSGESLWIVVVVDTTFTSSGSDDTLAVDLVTDDNPGLNSPTVVQRLGVFPAVSAAGTAIKARVPYGTYERYIGLLYTAATGALTAGVVTAAITKDIDSYKSYADAITIS